MFSYPGHTSEISQRTALISEIKPNQVHSQELGEIDLPTELPLGKAVVKS